MAVTLIKDIENFNVVVAEMLRLREQKKSVQTRLDEYKELVVKYMQAAKLAELTTEHVSVSRASYKVKRFDVNAFRKDKPKLYAKYLSEETVDRLYYAPAKRDE